MTSHTRVMLIINVTSYAYHCLLTTFSKLTSKSNFLLEPVLDVKNSNNTS